MTKKILLVDDEASLTRMMKVNLERSGDFEVRTENSGARAVATTREFQPDLIFLDIMMPGVSGEEIAAELRDDPELKDTPVVFLTAIVTKAEVAPTGTEIGGHMFLAKPVKTGDLLAVIEKTLGH